MYFYVYIHVYIYIYTHTWIYIIYTYLFTPWFYIFPEDDAWKFFSAILPLQFLLTIKPAPTTQCICCPTLYFKKSSKITHRFKDETPRIPYVTRVLSWSFKSLQPSSVFITFYISIYLISHYHWKSLIRFAIPHKDKDCFHTVPLSVPAHLTNDDIMAATDSFSLLHPKLQFISFFPQETIQNRKGASDRAKWFWTYRIFFLF